jgi:hypothetical protein
MNHNSSGDSAQTPIPSQAIVERTAVTAVHAAEETSPEERTKQRDQTDDNHPASRSNPRLQAALGCLDLKLEDELNRFRSKQTNRLADTPPQITSATAWESPSVDNQVEFDEKIITGEIVRSGIVGDTVDRFRRAEAPPTSESMVMDELIIPNPNLAAMTTVNDTPLSIYEEENSSAYENLDLNFAPRGEIAPFHVGYLASSQELLDRDQLGSTSESDVFEDPADSYLAPPKSQFFTFRKLSLMAMAWIIAGGAAYTYFNPNILAPLTATKVPTPTVATTGSLGQSIQSPNLAANEFSELNLSTINTIKVPTVATATNVNVATTPASVNPIGSAPVAIPFKGINSPAVSPAAITAQPQLADSLVKSLLPPNFHAFAKRVRTTQPMTGR